MPVSGPTKRTINKRERGHDRPHPKPHPKRDGSKADTEPCHDPQPEPEPEPEPEPQPEPQPHPQGLEERQIGLTNQIQNLEQVPRDTRAKGEGEGEGEGYRTVFGVSGVRVRGSGYCG
jgi:hypothetical protein